MVRVVGLGCQVVHAVMLGEKTKNDMNRGRRLTKESKGGINCKYLCRNQEVREVILFFLLKC